MTALLGRTARVLKLSSDEERAAESLLGRDHALARAISLQRTLAIQSLVVLVPVLLGSVGVLRHVEGAAVVLAAAGVVALALAVAAVWARRLTRDRARDLVAEGGDQTVLAAVVRERRRLASREVRESLARSLERLLHDAQRWHEIFPPSRPLPGVRSLRDAASEVAEVTAALRAEHVRVQGVALTARLLADGWSTLYVGDAERLREELRRIRDLLGAPSPRSVDTEVISAAAARPVPEPRLTRAARKAKGGLR